MKYVVRIALTILLSLLWAPFSVAQEQDKPMPDRWRGLILDQSTPEDSIRILGRTTSDKVEQIRIYRINKWVTAKQKEKIYRKLSFKKLEGVDSAVLSFLDNKLVMIELYIKKDLLPNALSNIYGVEFVPMVSAVDEALKPRNYERNQGRVYPKSYPTVYAMVAVSERSFISTLIENGLSFGGALKGTIGIGDAAGSFPGKVKLVQLISRTLENRDGADILK